MISIKQTLLGLTDRLSLKVKYGTATKSEIKQYLKAVELLATMK